MGGIKSIVTRRNSKRTKAYDEEILLGIAELLRRHEDEFAFSDREVAKYIGKSSSTISRERGGCKRFVQDLRSNLAKELDDLMANGGRPLPATGDIGREFCVKVVSVVIDYRGLFAIDIAMDGFRTTRLLVDKMQSLIKEDELVPFSGELYVLIQEIVENEDAFSFAKLIEFTRPLYDLIMKYRNNRMVIGIDIGKDLGEKQPSRKDGIFNGNKMEETHE